MRPLSTLELTGAGAQRFTAEWGPDQGPFGVDPDAVGSRGNVHQPGARGGPWCDPAGG